MAANIQEAIDDIALDIGGASGTVPPFIAARMITWLDLMFLVPAQFPAPGLPWNKDLLDQRSVYDWAVPTIQANAEIQALGSNGPLAGNIAINVVLRTLLAVQAALADNRITAAQVTSVVTAYTTAWE
jgi:hypothetical protein